MILCFKLYYIILYCIVLYYIILYYIILYYIIYIFYVFLWDKPSQGTYQLMPDWLLNRPLEPPSAPRPTRSSRVPC